MRFPWNMPSESSRSNVESSSHEPDEVLIVDDDEDLRLALCDVIEHFGERPCVSAAGLGDVEKLGARAMSSELAIIDVNLGQGQPNGMDVLRWLREHGFRGRAVFLTGHARSSPQVRMALEVAGADVLAKPIDLRVLCELLERPR